jgi:hypothetical protein
MGGKNDVVREKYTLLDGKARPGRNICGYVPADSGFEPLQVRKGLARWRKGWSSRSVCEIEQWPLPETTYAEAFLRAVSLSERLCMDTLTAYERGAASTANQSA